MNQKVLHLYSEAATLELRDRGKHTIIPPPPKKSAMDKARNREARISSQLRTNHWLSGVYPKRIGKPADAGRWFCEDRYGNIQPPTMTRTNVLPRCPTFEAVRREVWKDPTTGAFTRPRLIGALLGNPRWETRLLKFLETTAIGKVRPDKSTTRLEGSLDTRNGATSWKIPSRRMMKQSATVATMRQEGP
jgi:hypothetical protein